MAANGQYRSRPLFLATVAGILLYVVLDALAQSLPPHYSPISQAESDLAVGPFGYVMAINFVNRGVFSLLFVYGLYRCVPKDGFRGGLALMGVWGVGALILAVSPTDVNPPATLHGVVHLVVATLAFLCAAVGTLLLSRGFVRRTELGVTRLALPIAVLSVVFFLALYGGPVVAPHAAARVGGLTERVFIGLILVWMLAVSSSMLRRAGAAPGAR